ncbi:MAG: hypothetical protein ACE37F_12795 [Nannocystaceae bacterium]|nr:hypothetical protein [bacterium]
MARGPYVTPWPVAEAIALRLARHQARIVRVDAQASRRRLTRVLPEAAVAGALELAAGERPCSVDAVVSIEDALEPAPLCRQRLLERASAATDVVIMCEPNEPGRGVGRTMLRAIDPGVSVLRCDEVPDGIGGTRMRTEVEAPQTWFVASAAAWRFCDGAESIRDGFLRRLARMRPEQMVMGVRRILGRFPYAYELFVLAGAELANRSDDAGVQRLRGELTLHPGAPAWVLARLREAQVSTTALAPTAAQTGS